MTKTDQHDAPRELREHLGEILRREREARYGASPKEKQQFAMALDVGAKTIDRLEAGITTRGLEEYVAAYASLLLVEDPRPWWEEAVAKWRVGAPPPPPDLPEAFAKPIRDQAQRAQQAREQAARENPEGPSGRSDKKRASR